MRIAVFPGAFPALSETFIVRQITGLIDLGHRIDIYAERRAPCNAPLQPDVVAYGLLRRTRYIDIPAASGYWEMPVRPFTGQTWLPGADKPISNAARLRRAAPVLVRSAWRAPK